MNVTEKSVEEKRLEVLEIKSELGDLFKEKVLQYFGVAKSEIDVKASLDYRLSTKEQFLSMHVVIKSGNKYDEKFSYTITPNDITLGEHPSFNINNLSNKEYHAKLAWIGGIFDDVNENYDKIIEAIKELNDESEEFFILDEQYVLMRDELKTIQEKTRQNERLAIERDAIEIAKSGVRFSEPISFDVARLDKALNVVSIHLTDTSSTGRTHSLTLECENAFSKGIIKKDLSKVKTKYIIDALLNNKDKIES